MPGLIGQEVISLNRNHLTGMTLLHFLRALPVGTRERVVLIRYRDKEYMLGVTPGGISLLDKNPVAAEPSDTSPTNSLTHQTDGASDSS